MISNQGPRIEKIAGEIISALGDLGVAADRFTTGEGVAGINVWGPSGRYPLTSITVSLNDRFSDIAWGDRYENVVSVDTPPGEVAKAVAAWVRSRPTDADGA